MKNIDPTKIFPNIDQKSVSKGGNFAEPVTWLYLFQVKVYQKKNIIGPWFILSHIYYIKVTNGAESELIQRWLIWKTFGHIENAQKLGHPQKSMGKSRQHLL